ncbi:STAS domain-containing protein [Dactylosporangium sp. CA-139066]|uniref:STAS domain-containing protein n=1 Tax=Dactylosporangium sp. CA-139066 TaxID=3239930 RepID=UPI003D93745D
MDLSLTIRPGRGCVVVQAGGVLDLATTPDVRERLQQAVDEGARHVVLDLAGVRLIDSTALGMIVWLHKQLVQDGGGVCIAGARPMVRTVFELTSVDRLVGIYDSVEAAEDSLAADAAP